MLPADGALALPAAQGGGIALFCPWAAQTYYEYAHVSNVMCSPAVPRSRTALVPSDAVDTNFDMTLATTTVL